MTFMSARRGQSLALLAITLLVVTVMVMMTLSIGVSTARRTDLNNLADTAAYSSAIATARTFNTASLLNRAIVSHYVTMAGIQAQLAYTSSGHNYFNLAANQFRMLDEAGPYPVSMGDVFDDLAPRLSCAARSTEIDDARNELWHASLSWYARGVAPDQVNGFCHGPTCSMYRDWLAEPLGQMEKAAGQQAASVHDAIHDLSWMERDTFIKLYDTLTTGDMVRQVAERGGIDSRLSMASPGGLEMGQELRGATNSTSSEFESIHKATFHRPFAEAILGTRRHERLVLPGATENLAPLVRRIKAQTDAAFAAYGGPLIFAADFTPGDTSADFSEEPTIYQPGIEEPVGYVSSAPGVWLTPSMKYSYGRVSRGKVTVKYLDRCDGSSRWRVLHSGIGDGLVQVDAKYPTIKYDPLPFGIIIRSGEGVGTHTDYESDHMDGTHWLLVGGGCHGYHDHYGMSEESIHQLPGQHVLPAEVLGFVMPDSAYSEKGAGGVWGQPVLPTVVSKQNPPNDPWNLAFTFHARRSSRGAELDMKKEAGWSNAVSSGIAFYQRRGHLGEPPNMLNPFWRASLVPNEIDERDDGQRIGSHVADPTADTQARGAGRMNSMITSGFRGYPEEADRAQARNAYDGLKDKLVGMQVVPQPEYGATP